MKETDDTPEQVDGGVDHSEPERALCRIVGSGRVPHKLTARKQTARRDHLLPTTPAWRRSDLESHPH